MSTGRNVTYVNTFVVVMPDGLQAIGLYVEYDDGSAETWKTNNPKFYQYDPNEIGKMYKRVVGAVDMDAPNAKRWVFDTLRSTYNMVLHRNEGE